MEMHTTLQRLGCQPYYLEITRREVAFILRGIVANPMTAHPETAQAYSNGELPDIDDYPDTFQTRLGEIGIRYAADPHWDRSWDINQAQLAQILAAPAGSRGRRTETPEERRARERRAANDARAVAIILQLRQGFTTDAIGSSKDLFISSNPMLQRVSKRFLQQELEDYYEDTGAIPPVVTVGQIATLSWLSSPHEVADKQITQDLLISCYNAVRPDARFFGKYTQVFTDYARKNPSVIRNIADSAIFASTVRQIVQDATQNREEAIREENFDDWIKQAQQESAAKEAHAAAQRQQADQELREQLRLAIELKISLENELADERRRNLEEARQRAETEARQRAEAEARERAQVEARQRAEAEARERAEAEARKLAEAEARHVTQSAAHSKAIYEAIFKVVIVSLLIGSLITGLYLLRDSIVLCSFLLIFFIAILPALIAVVFEHKNLTEVGTIYKIGVSSLPLLGDLFGRLNTSPLPESADRPGVTPSAPSGGVGRSPEKEKPVPRKGGERRRGTSARK